MPNVESRGSSAPSAVQLTPRFDVIRLLADWEALASVVQQPQPGQYHSGGWRGISLVSPGGLATWAGACLPVGLRPGKTPLLDRAPYFDELLDSLSGVIESARLLTLLPGESIAPHRDNLTNLRSGVARLHVPLVTHSDVEFVVAGVNYRLEPGSLWYADFAKPHAVYNRSNTPRVHLVVDVIANEHVLGLFPETYLNQLSETDVFLPSREIPHSTFALPVSSRRYQLAPALRREAVALRKFAIAATKGERAHFASQLASDEGLVLSFSTVQSSPVLCLDDLPYAALSPISPSSFRMFGFLPCLTGHIDAEGVRFLYKTRVIGRCRALGPSPDQ